jgi:hypothetical protein
LNQPRAPHAQPAALGLADIEGAFGRLSDIAHGNRVRNERLRLLEPGMAEAPLIVRELMRHAGITKARLA